MNTELLKEIESLLPQMTDTLGTMISYPAISPIDGGCGEYHKAQYLVKKIKELGFDNTHIIASPDEHAAGGQRPNIIVKYPGRTKKRFWIVAHIDVVPEGERSLWQTDPFKAVVKDGRIYGRGVSDNGQEAVAAIYALYALKELGITPEYEVCLALVADEEVGSMHGIQYLIKQKLFNNDDLIIVPDMGSEDGSLIEIAEKSICWIEFVCNGKQVHGSMPHLGKNACRAANELSCALDIALHNAFPDINELFTPPVSTFEPTRRRANVANINTVPGREIFSFDCRVLPHIPLEEVQKIVDAEIKRIEEKHGVTISYTFPQKIQAPAPTDESAPVIVNLKAALAEVFPGMKPKVCGVGGGTCGAFFRKEGIQTAVWGQEADVAHMPNEYAVLEHIVNESKVFALMMTGISKTQGKK